MEPNSASDAWGKQDQRPHRLYRAAALGALLAGALGYIGLIDPHDTSSLYPQCAFKLLTGWNCPACGGLRMMHDLLHGDLAGSIDDNVALLVGIPVLAGWMVVRRRAGRPWLSIPAVVAITIAATAWTVVRNLPGFPLVPSVLNG